MTKPVGITMGDPCGIGPEIVARVFADGLPHDAIVIGDAGVMQRAVNALGLALKVQSISSVADVVAGEGVMPVLSVSDLPVISP